MSALQKLLDQKAALEREIESTRKQEKAEAISKVRTLMAEHGLSLADLSLKPGPRASGGKAGKGGKVAAKYRKADTGESWSGRGLQPKWLKAALASGKKLGDFAL